MKKEHLTIYFYDRDDALGDLSPTIKPRNGIEAKYIIDCFNIVDALEQIFKKEGNIIGLDLSLQNDTEWKDLKKFNFCNKKFTACRFVNFDFSQHKMDGVILNKCFLESVKFPENMDNCDLSDSYLENTILENITFKNCILKNIKKYNVKTINVTFSNTKDFKNKKVKKNKGIFAIFEFFKRT